MDQQSWTFLLLALPVSSKMKEFRSWQWSPGRTFQTARQQRCALKASIIQFIKMWPRRFTQTPAPPGLEPVPTLPSGFLTCAPIASPRLTGSAKAELNREGGGVGGGEDEKMLGWERGGWGLQVCVQAA